MFSCKPSKQRFKDYDYSNRDIGFGVSSFDDDDGHGDDGEQASDAGRRCFRNILVILTPRKDIINNVVFKWRHRGVSPAALFPFSGALPALSAVAYGSRVVRQQVSVLEVRQRTRDAGHTAALSMCLCPPHAALNSSFSSISRKFQLQLQLTGGMSHALLRKCSTRARMLVACKVASSLARDVFRCFNEEADCRWVSFNAMMQLWHFLKGMPRLSEC